MIEIKEIKNKQEWEDFLNDCQEKTFLISWNWGNFHEKMGHKIWRLGIYKENQQIGCFLVVKIKAKFRTFIFVPHGPVLKNEYLIIFNLKKDILEQMTKFLKNLSEQESADFVRIAPIWENSRENKKIFEDIGFTTAPTHIHPEVTWLLDITGREEEILMQMRKNTRNLIRRAIKEGVKIIKDNSQKGIDKFNELYKETVGRQHFVPFSFNYLKNEFESFCPDNQIINFFAEYNGKIISSAMIILWQKIGFYHQGASSLEFSKIPSSYLLQWEAIKEAKKNGCQLYNFWGIVPEIEKSKDLKNAKIKKHPWWGLSLFKIGFGGSKKEYLKTQDLPITFRYYLHKIIENLRKIKRGY